MEFQTFHNYNRLVRRGIVKPLACPHCENEFALSIGEDDEPVLKCFFCGTLTLPGLDMYNRVRAVVTEHFL